MGGEYKPEQGSVTNDGASTEPAGQTAAGQTGLSRALLQKKLSRRRAAQTGAGSGLTAEPELAGDGGGVSRLNVYPDGAAEPLRLGKVQVAGATSGLRVRSAPKRGDNVVGMLSEHEQTRATGEVGEWVQIDRSAGPGYVHRNFVEPVTESASPDPAAAIHVPKPVSAHVAEETTPAPVQHIAKPAAVAPVVFAAPMAPATSGAPNSATAPSPAVHSAGLVQSSEQTVTHTATFTTDMGNEVTKTTEEEATVLNQIRANPVRLDPIWLRRAQEHLHVIDSTGAMNKETLVALRTFARSPIGADGIMNEAFLATILKDGISPFFATTELGFPTKKEKPASGAISNKDKTVQELKFGSFAEYASGWPDVMLLGKKLGVGHPYLENRIRIADAYLRARHPEVKRDGKTEKQYNTELQAACGWSGEGNASYADDPTNPNTHQHAMGLAIDIDPKQNAYLFDHHVTGITPEQSDWWVGTFADIFAIAATVYGGEKIDSRTLMTWSKTMSTEELFPKVQAASSGFGKLLALSKRGAKTEMQTVLAPHFKGSAYDKALFNVQNADRWFHTREGQREAKAPTNLSQDIVIALRDVAGLAWGGTELDKDENGDFMHFDCRQTDFGSQVYASGKKHRKG